MEQPSGTMAGGVYTTQIHGSTNLFTIEILHLHNVFVVLCDYEVDCWSNYHVAYFSFD